MKTHEERIKIAQEFALGQYLSDYKLEDYDTILAALRNDSLLPGDVEILGEYTTYEEIAEIIDDTFSHVLWMLDNVCDDVYDDVQAPNQFPKAIVIGIQGGCLTGVSATNNLSDVKVYLADYDNQEELADQEAIQVLKSGIALW